MLQVRIGPHKMPRQSVLKFWKFIVAALSVAGFFAFVIHKYSDLFSVGGDKETATERLKMEIRHAGPCPVIICAEDHFSFFIQSGAASVVPPRICFKNELVLGAPKNNAGLGINVVILNGKTGELVKTGHFDMWAGEVNPLIELLQKIEIGSIVLMTSYDEPASKLNEEARGLILELGSGFVKTLGFRDNWIFVGGKGATVKSAFEKHEKNDQSKNKYDGWPELIDLSGCIPKYLG